MPHPERCPPSREPRPPPQGGGGSNLLRGDPSLFPCLSAQPKDPRRPGERGGKGWGETKKKVRGLQRLTGDPLLRPPGWSAAGSGQEGAGAEAALPSGMRRGGRSAAPGGGRRGGTEPGLRAAARSRQSPAHHRPPRRPGLPLRARRRPGRCWSGTHSGGRGAPRRRIPPDTLQPGLLLRGRSGGGQRRARGRRRAGAGEEGGRGSKAQRAGSRAAAGPPPARAHRRLRGPAPHARKRGAARGAAEALTPPAPSAAAAAARTGGARGRRRRSSPSRLLPATLAARGARAGAGWGCRAGRLGSEEVWRGGLRSCGLRANHCNSKSCAA